MTTLAFPGSKTVTLMAAALALLATPARGHVGLLAPNGGEELEVGSVFTISWRIQIAHPLLNWDLWYSTTGPTGPWTAVAENLPPGSPAEGSIHTYDWTVPNDPDDSAWVRVKMDNSGTDYYDTSNSSFSIVLPCPWDLDGDDRVGIADLLALLAAWGTDPGGPPDFDGDGMVGIGDLLALLTNWGACP
ncbi:MAG: hypothetical protein ACYS0G_06875 [Planctomycetota bacterium]|jgi:hypothetical protein